MLFYAFHHKLQHAGCRECHMEVVAVLWDCYLADVQALEVSNTVT